MASYSPQFHVPGTFHFDTSPKSGQALSAGIFRPPATSPSTSAYGSLYSDISMTNTGNGAAVTGTAKRKRASTRSSTPMGWNMDMDGAHDVREEEKSRQFRYTLAGQINATPMGAPVGAENGLLEDSVYSDVDYRRALGPTKVAPEFELPSAQHHETPNPPPPTSTGWRIFTLGTIGEVVGKVWEFCTKGAFRGFQAGGGTAYAANGTTIPEATGKPWCNEHDVPTLPNEVTRVDQMTSDRIPESAYDVEKVGPYTSFSPHQDSIRNADSLDSTPQPPAAKRRQVSYNNDELKNWVVVDDPANTNQRRFGSDARAVPVRTPASIVRPSPRPGYYSSTAVSSGRRISAPSARFTGGTPTRATAVRPPLRNSHAGSPLVQPREPASFASPRQPQPVAPSPVRTPSRIPMPIQPATSNPFAALASPGAFPAPSSASRPSSRQSPRLGLGGGVSSRPISPTKTTTSAIHRRNQSGASASATARRHSLLAASVDPEEIKASQRLDAEAKALAARKLAAERDADMKVDAFNARLMAMIRQGREALGTKVEVEMADEDEIGGGGWEDEDVF
ncbi:hypothetical protein QBC40DRAFT_306295 [Triangularia verruculosa]|uniref:Uncharacterized protein n=1 Tax=Triangularia verruculosa TaxID=2587418 RepID=A0AAN7AWI1_9PEZI|nr:hypothetical protein QBC40DRAFT_306295 [Triangularia verruculosa]